MLAGTLAACSMHAQPGGGEEKVAVCHKGKKTLYVAKPALEAHYGHGDTPGPCR